MDRWVLARVLWPVECALQYIGVRMAWVLATVVGAGGVHMGGRMMYRLDYHVCVAHATLVLL